MKKLIYLMMVTTLMSLPFSCASKRKSVTIDKESKAVELNQTIDHNQLTKIDSESQFESFEITDFAQALSSINWNYMGSENQSFALEIKQTDKGYRIEASGSGSANGSQEINRSTNEKFQSQNNKIDSAVTDQINSKIDTEIKTNSSTKSKQVEKESNDFSLGFYVILGLISILMLIILLRKVKLKKNIELNN